MKVVSLSFSLSFINAQIALPTFQAVHKFNTAAASSSLYNFTSQTFTNCDATGGGTEGTSYTNGGGGGAGLTENGTHVNHGNADALSFKNGGTGGSGHPTYGIAHGGFGGGGPGGGNPGGGGGGMSGGDYGRGGYNPNNLSVGYNLGGKAGGSYTSGNNTTFYTSDWDNHGKVVITKQ